MEPVFLDIHIHTSEDPSSLNDNYDIDTLVKKINEFTEESTFLISLTDHNTVNKKAYLSAIAKVENLLLGVELHIRNYDQCPPYHCHIYFNLPEITSEIIDDINSKLDTLYPKKVVSNEDNIPRLEVIIKTFDNYDFLLLPHGGQSHSTFDTSIPDGVKFDSAIERSVYYNQFDGFTARGNTRLEKTQEYFTKLGINEFVNLVTCTDNYVPLNYPKAKSSKANPFVPTWMLALPTFNGLRLSLSESSRLIYSDTKPKVWSEHIKSAILKNDFIDMDALLTPGLNVVIGGSSTGKTLFVDSVFRKITNDLTDSKYLAFGIEQLKVDNPSGVRPHYLSQNYIMKIVSDSSDDRINNIDIIRNVFPGDDSNKAEVDKGLMRLKTDLKELIKCVKVIEEQTKQLSRIPLLTRLITKKDVKDNIIEKLLPTEQEIKKIEYSKNIYADHIEILDQIDTRLKLNPFIKHDESLITKLKEEIESAFKASTFSIGVKAIIQEEKDQYDRDLKSSNIEEQTKKQNFDKLLASIKLYSKNFVKFHETLKKISEYSIKCDSEEVLSMGHKLYIENAFKLNKEKLFEVINHYLKTDSKIEKFEDIQPDHLFETNFKKQTPKVKDYDDFEIRVNKDFENLNKRTYKIITSNGKKFEELSAGWKTSVILDIILGFEGDIAPIIIDQPEDNLATNYINKGLVKAIKAIKSKKQIILVSHNATIPMLGDAQNIVLCLNKGNKIEIKTSRLEGEINNKNILDYIAEITDGGKPSIKKRVKKYNLKNFKEEKNEADI